MRKIIPCLDIKDGMVVKREVFNKTNVSAALAASVFHFGKFTVKDVKKYLERA